MTLTLPPPISRRGGFFVSTHEQLVAPLAHVFNSCTKTGFLKRRQNEPENCGFLINDCTAPPDSHRGGHSYGQGIRVALVVAVMMVMMVVGRWVAVIRVAAPFSPAPPLGATVASEW